MTEEKAAVGRPRKHHSCFVAQDGPSWVGFWSVYSSEGKRLQRRRKIALVSSMSKEAALVLHSKWVAHNVASNREQVSSHVEASGKGFATSTASRIPRQRMVPAKIGAASELVVAADLISRGYSVYRSVCPNAACDLIAYDERNLKLIRVEVKTRDGAEGTTKGIYGLNADHFDVVAVVSRDGKIWYVPNQNGSSIVPSVVLSGEGDN